MKRNTKGDKKKRITKAIAVAFVIMLMFTACSVPGKKYTSVEEYYQANQTTFDDAEKQVQDELGDDIKFEMSYQDNTIIYQYTYNTDMDKTTFSNAMEGEFEKQSSQFTSLANQLKKETGLDECIVKIVMLNNSGVVLAEKEYKAE